MLQMEASTPIGDDPVRAASAAAEPLSTMVYSSRAVNPLSGSDLLRLAHAAQARNRAESITGLMLYDEARFYQWLEGPTEGLARVMRSIRDDPRHTEIEVLNDQPITERCFGDWHMKLATSGRTATAWKREVIKPPREIIKGLRRDPDAAPALLVKLAPGSPGSQTGKVPAPGTVSQVALKERTASILRTLIPAAVMTELVARRGLAPGLPKTRRLPTDPRARELARLLIASDRAAAIELIKQARGNEHLVLRLYETLFEPAARGLGDLLSEDACTEFDVTLGLCQLQAAVRVLSAGLPPLSRTVPSAPVVLVAPAPGELHALGAVLDAEMLWNAGWAPRCEYPASDAALQDLLAATWFDALDLSLSAALPRERWLPRVARTIALSRRASRNPHLAIVVSGRITEQEDACVLMGADAVVTTALHIKREVLHVLDKARPSCGSRRN